MRLVEERMNGGAVREERSPLKDEMDLMKDVQLALVAGFWDAASAIMFMYVTATERTPSGLILVG